MAPRDNDPSYSYQANEKYQPRAGLLNEILLETAWIGYWDEDAWGDDRNGQHSTESPCSQRFRENMSSYKELVDMRLDSNLKPAIVPSSDSKLKKGVWRKYHKTIVPDPTKPTLISISARSGFSVWAYKFRDQNIGKDVFTIFGKAKNTQRDANRSPWDKYTYLLRNETGYSATYFMRVDVEPKNSSRNPHRNTKLNSSGQEKDRLERSFPSPESDNMEMEESFDDQGTHQVCGEEERLPTERTHKPTTDDYERNIYYENFPQPRPGRQRLRYETARPDVPPFSNSWRQHREPTQSGPLAAEKANEIATRGTPELAARSRNSFPNMERAGHINANFPVEYAVHVCPQLNPDNTASRDVHCCGAAQKRPRARDSGSPDDVEEILPPKDPKRLRRVTTSSGEGSSTVDLEAWRTRRIPRVPTATQDVEKSRQPAGSGMQSLERENAILDQRKTNTTNSEPRTASATPQQPVESVLPRETSLPIRASVERATTALEAMRPPQISPGHHERASEVSEALSPPQMNSVKGGRTPLDIYVDGGSGTGYAIYMERCKTVEELFSEVHKEIKGELKTGETIKSMKFRLDLIPGASSGPRYVSRDNAAGFDVLRIRIDECREKGVKGKLVIVVHVQIEQND